MTETPQTITTRRTALHLLTLIEQSAHNARTNMCLGDEFLAQSQAPRLAIPGQPAADPAQQHAMSMQLSGVAKNQVHDVVNLTQRLGVLLGMLTTDAPAEAPPTLKLQGT